MLPNFETYSSKTGDFTSFDWKSRFYLFIYLILLTIQYSSAFLIQVLNAAVTPTTRATRSILELFQTLF